MDKTLKDALAFRCDVEKLNQEIQKMREYWYEDNIRLFEQAVRESSEKRYDYSSALLEELLFRIQREKETPLYREDSHPHDGGSLDKITMLALYCKGQNYFSTRKYDGSFAYFHQAFEICEQIQGNKKFQAGLINNCGLIMFSTGCRNGSAKQVSDSLGAIQFALSLDPGNALYYNNLGHMFFQLNQYRDAEPFLRKAIALDDTLPVPHNNLGSTLFHLGQYPESEQEFRSALALDSRYPDPHNNLGNVLQVMEKYDEAESEYRDAIRLNPEFAHPHCFLGSLLRKTKRYAEAEKEFLEALRLAPNFTDAHFNYGNFLVERGRLDEARKEYNDTLKIDPNYVKASYMLSQIT